VAPLVNDVIVVPFVAHDIINAPPPDGMFSVAETVFTDVEKFVA
jgi:hypothetical protein